MLTRGTCAGVLAMAFSAACVRAEITASADFPLTPVTKAVKADPHAQLLELYRQDVLAEQVCSKQKAGTPSESSTR